MARYGWCRDFPKAVSSVVLALMLIGMWAVPASAAVELSAGVKG